MVREQSAKLRCGGSIPPRSSIMGVKRTFFWEILPPEKLWYLVGLITADGCLSPDGRHIDITAKYREFLKQLKQVTKINAGSDRFLKWLNQMLKEVFNAKGSIYFESYANSYGYILKISKQSYLKKILKKCYQNDEIALTRKRTQALECIAA